MTCAEVRAVVNTGSDHTSLTLIATVCKHLGECPACNALAARIDREREVGLSPDELADWLAWKAKMARRVAEQLSFDPEL
jgi:hypothetical protein